MYLSVKYLAQVDLATCSAYIGEECEYSGDRLGKTNFDPLLELLLSPVNVL